MSYICIVNQKRLQEVDLLDVCCWK